MDIKMDRKSAECLASILNYLWDKHPDDLGPVEETGFGFTTPVSDGDTVIELSMADGSMFEDGVKDLWAVLTRKGV